MIYNYFDIDFRKEYLKAEKFKVYPQHFLDELRHKLNYLRRN